jgi:hypothetical protein
MVRVIQISDTHLSRSKAHFAANWPPVCDGCVAASRIS